MADELSGSKVLVTGVTGQVAMPLAIALTERCEVVGAARFTSEAKRAELEAAGVACVIADLESGELDAVPDDVDYVLNFAVAKTNDWDRDLEANVGGLLSLMERTAKATAFLHCSSTAVYKPMGHHVFSEEGPYGDNHGVWEFLRTYSTAKIASESAARWAARRHGLRTTIARLSVPYGAFGGWPAVHLEMMRSGAAIPVHVDAPSTYHPIHEDDIARQVPALLAAASVPATVVNWGGSDPVSIEEWCDEISRITGLEARFEPTAATIDSVMVDLTRLGEIAGSSQVPWREGIRRMVEARRPELLG